MGLFSTVKIPRVKSSVFDLTEEMKLSCNFGDLVPICCKEVLPSDKFRISTEMLIKLAPLAAPVMHRIQAYVHYFFVPNFQISDVFERFINPKVNTSSNPIFLPYCAPSLIKRYGQVQGTTGGLVGSLSDYLGLPVTQTSWLNMNTSDGGYVNVFPFIAYQHIYNSYYRDQNLEVLENANVSTSTLFLVDKYMSLVGDVGVTGQIYNTNQYLNLFKLRKRAWAKDYFTSALPSPQAGDDVLLPITSQVDIESDGQMLYEGDGVVPPTAGANATWQRVGSDWGLGTGSGSSVNPVQYKSGLKGTAVNTSATVNHLRISIALQKFKELAERGGTRYPEMVRNFFNSYLPDFYVGRPIFLGGQKLPISIGEVVQTSKNDATTGDFLGSRAGIGSGYGNTKSAYLKSPCHGYLIGILSIRPKAEYMQGLERMWTRKSLFDFAWPQFAQLGEQEIFQQELFAGGTASDNNTIFGYTPRYAEYKTSHSHIAGEFRNTLKDWHFAREFANAPVLSREFVMMDNVRYDPFNVTSSQTEHVYVNLINKITARRPLPYYGTPGIL